MKISEETRTAILAAKGTDTQVNIAADFDVAEATVWAIWNPERAREMRKRATDRARERRHSDPSYAEQMRRKWREVRA